MLCLFKKYEALERGLGRGGGEGRGSPSAYRKINGKLMETLRSSDQSDSQLS